MLSKNSFVQGSLFEEDYLLRTLGPLAHSAEVALTELVANAWDAGASKVSIIIPSAHGEEIVIQDDGIGLTPEQFHNRWMKLGYNRIKHQGDKVEFPDEKEGNRLAYGRNGIGRHGLLCFNNEYLVQTCAKSIKSTFVVTTLSEKEPFVLKEESVEDGGGASRHGTRLTVTVKRNLPNPETILSVISARFLHDPQFSVEINGKSVPLEEHSGLIDASELKMEGITVHCLFIDTQKAAKSTRYQGVAFWQAGRLVGEPSWILGKESVLDGRSRFAKRYTVVVKTNDLSDHILDDWTGFKKDNVMDTFYSVIHEYIIKMIGKISKETIEETKSQIKSEFDQEMRSLPPLARYEVNEAIETLTSYHPTAKYESISLMVDTVIKLGKTRSGKELLEKLSQLNDNDVDGLNRLLNDWSVKDALTVLDEIDKRISVVDAIGKLSSNPDIDELRVLHPLITESRWLFGVEFDSPEYTSNRQLQTAVRQLFGIKTDDGLFVNKRKRPDILVLPDSTISATCTDSFDQTTKLVSINRILLVELKRGGFKIGRNERNQAVSYVEDLTLCGGLIGSPYIFAYVVGESFSENLQPKQSVKNSNDVEVGVVNVTTFSQLVDTAERRLFGLRDKLRERYDNIPEICQWNECKQSRLSLV